MSNIVSLRARDPNRVMFVCDFTPPRGSDASLLENDLDIPSDVISVAYNPGKSVRVSSALAAHWIQTNTKLDVMFTIATRDMNKIAIESFLLGSALLGLENLVIVKGDQFRPAELSLVKPVDDFKPTELIKAVTSMNDGLDFKGGSLRSKTNFCIGATIDLGLGLHSQVRLTRYKILAGAQFFLMQAVFEPKLIKQFHELYQDTYGQELSTPIFYGLQVITVESLVFCDVPDWINKDLETGRPPTEIASEALNTFVESGFKSIYLIPPILSGGRRDYRAASQVINSFRQQV